MIILCDHDYTKQYGESMSYISFIRMIFFSFLIFSLNGCDDQDSTTIESLKKIGAFAENSENPEPTIQDYFDANVTEITADTLISLNSKVESLDKSDVDTTEELNNIALAVFNNQPIAKNDLGSVLLEVTDSDLSEYSAEELAVEIPLIAIDDDPEDTLTYSIAGQPKYGKAELSDGSVYYTPNTNYLGTDSFSFKANDGIEDSNIAQVSFTVISEAESANYPCFANRASGSPASKCDTGDLTKIKSHLIWFNGTSEDFSENKHLFADLNSKDYSIIKGWGLKPFWADKGRFYNSAISGVENEPEILARIDKYIHQYISANLERIKNSDTLMIGGFSRGAAFFVPYFLKHLDTFVPNISATTHTGNKKTIYIYLMDPVTGSSSATGNTATTLQAQNIYSKNTLIQTLKGKGYSLKLIFMSSGFDKRQKNFVLDKTFHDEKDKFDYYYSAKIGLTHANMSIWSTNYKDKVIRTLKYGPYSPGFFGSNVEDRKTERADFLSELLNQNSDLKITKPFFAHYLADKNDSNYQSNAQNLEGTIESLHNATDKYLGEPAANKNYGASYDADKSYKAGGYTLIGDAIYKISGHSRLPIKKHGTINELFK